MQKPSSPHSGVVVPASALALSHMEPLTVAEIYEEHAGLVWSNLSRLGVRESDLPDMTQEVFMVVHRRLRTWDGESRMTTWLFGICRKVAAGYRRRSWFKRVRPTDTPLQSVDPGASPEECSVLTEAQQRLRLVLDGLPPERRAIFLLFEFEERSSAEIAALFDIPLGTVHSRLRLARRDFRTSLNRLKEKEKGKS